MARSGAGKGAGRAALVGVLSALSLVFLYASALVPTGQMGVVAVAGLLVAAAVVSGGLSAGFLCYGATGLLGLLLLPDKANALLYLLFFGLWPILKSLIERLRRIILEWVCKLGVLNAVLTLFWFGLRAVLLPFLPGALHQIGMVYLAGNAAFVIYDVGCSKLIAFYAGRIDKVLRKAG